MRKKKRLEKPSLEMYAEQYRDAVMLSGNIDEADRLLETEIRPPCKRLMHAYGIEWNPTLESFLCTILLHFSRFDGVTFLSFFLYHARNNFDIPDKPVNTDEICYQGSGLNVFLRTWESHPERHSVAKADRAIRKKRQSERRAAADPAD